jgi:hypothetical protein
MTSPTFKLLLKKAHVAVLCLVAVLSLTLLYKDRGAKAVSQTTLSGSCGIIFTANINGWEGVAKTFGAEITNNAIGTINFDSGIYGVKFNNVTPYGHATHVDEVFRTSTGALSFVSFNSNTGVYEYTATDSSSPTDIVHISVLPVNSGNTFLITAYSQSSGSETSPVSSGVCQKV